MSAPRLSLLVAALDVRTHSRERLLRLLARQGAPGPEVEVLVEEDNGRLPTGTKRNALLGRACGEYVAFVDDDDLVSDDYVARVLAAMKDAPDCVALEGCLVDSALSKRRFLHSIEHDGWFERDGTYYRTPNHLNAVRRELATKAGFPDLKHGEDRAYSERLRPLVRSEAATPGGPLYFYLAHPRSRMLPGLLRVLFKYPTRERPDLFLRTLRAWCSRLAQPERARLVVSLDVDDMTMVDPRMRANIDGVVQEHGVSYQVAVGASGSKVHAVNRDIPPPEDEDGPGWDVMVIISDDMTPVEDRLDEMLAVDFARTFPDLDGCLSYDDGYQVHELGRPKIATLAVMGARYYRRHGSYVYHPAYRSEWCDNEMTEVARREGKLVELPRMLARHDWVGTHVRDDLHRRNNAHYKADKATYERRASEGFP